jgi:hypothetical protein
VKARPIAEVKLRASWNELSERLARHDRGDSTYEELKRNDRGESTFRKESEGLEIPQIPNLGHWFRRYVVIDLARIRSEITLAQGSRRVSEGIT